MPGRGFKKKDKVTGEQKFHPIDDKKGVSSKTIQTSTEVSEPGVEKSGKTLKVEKPENHEPKQVRQKLDEDGDPIVEETVRVYKWDVDIPPEEDKDDVVDDFLETNKLYTKVKNEDPYDNKVPIDDDFAVRLEKGFENAGMITDYPGGSVYLGTDGDWYGGESYYGYDEDHRPQIRTALRFGALEILKPDGKHPDGSEVMITALKKSGIMRGRVDRESLSLDIFQPLTPSQQRAIKDLVIEMQMDRNNIYIDLNGNENLTEGKILRQIGAFEDFGDDY